MTEILLPVGQPLGQMDGFDGPTDSAERTVRVGADYVALAPTEYQTWFLAMVHGDRGAVLDAARDLDISAPERVIESLVADDVLVELDPDDLEADFARLCLVPMGFGNGQSPDTPGCLQIAGPDLQTRATVELDLFMLWAQGSRRSLWDGCEALAKEMGVPTAEAAREVAPRLTILVGAGCALLDAMA